jgi:hypothetical protein
LAFGRGREGKLDYVLALKILNIFFFGNHSLKRIFQSIIFNSPTSSYLLTDVDNTGAFYSFIWSFKYTIATIFDGGLIGGIAWSLLQVISLLQAMFTYYDTKELFIRYKMEEAEKDLLKEATKKEMLKD